MLKPFLALDTTECNKTRRRGHDVRPQPTGHTTSRESRLIRSRLRRYLSQSFRRHSFAEGHLQLIHHAGNGFGARTPVTDDQRPTHVALLQSSLLPAPVDSGLLLSLFTLTLKRKSAARPENYPFNPNHAC